MSDSNIQRSDQKNYTSSYANVTNESAIDGNEEDQLNTPPPIHPIASMLVGGIMGYSVTRFGLSRFSNYVTNPRTREKAIYIVTAASLFGLVMSTYSAATDTCSTNHYNMACMQTIMLSGASVGAATAAVSTVKDWVNEMRERQHHPHYA